MGGQIPQGAGPDPNQLTGVPPKLQILYLHVQTYKSPYVSKFQFHKKISKPQETDKKHLVGLLKAHNFISFRQVTRVTFF